MPLYPLTPSWVKDRIIMRYGISLSGQALLDEAYGKLSAPEVKRANKNAKKYIQKCYNIYFKHDLRTAGNYRFVFTAESSPQEHGSSEGVKVIKSFDIPKGKNLSWALVAKNELDDVLLQVSMPLLQVVLGHRNDYPGFESVDGAIAFIKRLDGMFQTMHAELVINDGYPDFLQIT